MTSRIAVPADSDFPIENLPYGLFATAHGPHLATAVGDHLVDLAEAGEAGLLPHADLLGADSLHPLLAAGAAVWSEVRAAISDLLTSDRFDRLPAGAVRERAGVVMLLPFHPGDYVDFYSSRHHAENLGRLFRPGADPLPPNWRHLPIGYHGRASSVVVSGTPVRRPRGLWTAPGGVVHAPTEALDFELEVGFVTGPGNERGVPIPADAAGDHIFGLVLVNDWSARDIQRFEYVPLGPFLGKSFATTVSPWVVTLQALAPYRVAGPPQEPLPAPYLRTREPWGLDLHLEVELRPAGGSPEIVSRTGFADMYWTMAQQLAHVTGNGATVRPGDLHASGTVSGSAPGTQGSMIELTANGAAPLRLGDGTGRSFLADGDTVTLRGWCRRPGVPRIGFGECTGTVVPA